jgi:hypothetical protein
MLWTQPVGSESWNFKMVSVKVVSGERWAPLRWTPGAVLCILREQRCPRSFVLGVPQLWTRTLDNFKSCPLCKRKQFSAICSILVCKSSTAELQQNNNKLKHEPAYQEQEWTTKQAVLINPGEHSLSSLDHSQFAAGCSSCKQCKLLELLSAHTRQPFWCPAP